MVLHRQLERLRAVVTRASAAFEAGRTWEADGARTAAAWVSARCRTPMAAARQRVRLGRELRSMPATEEAWLAGEVGEAHVEAMAAERRQVGVERFDPHEATLVGYAADLPYRGFRRAVAYWSQVVDPDGAEERAADQREGRRLHLSQSFEGVWFLDGVLDPFGGEVVAGALRRIEAELFAADWAEAKERVGEGVRACDLARTPPSAGPTRWWRWPGGPRLSPPGPACPSPSSACWWATRPWPGGCANWPAAPCSPPGRCCAG